MRPGLGKFIRYAFTALIIAFLVIFARTIDWDAAWRAMRSASAPLLIAATVVHFLSMAIKGVRWWIFLKPAGSPSLGLALRASLAGSGLSNVLVAHGGDAARVVFVSRATGIPSSTVLATLTLERLSEPVGFMVLLVFAAVAFTLPESLERLQLPAEILLVLIAIAIVWFIRASKRSTPSPASVSVAAPVGINARFKKYLSQFVASTRLLITGPRFFWALVISMVAWAGQVATFQLAAAAAHVPIPPAASLAALLAVNLGLLVRATPGNVGFFQVVFALTVQPFGISRSDAIAVSLLIQTLQILPVTLVGVALAPEFIFKRNALGGAGQSAAAAKAPAS